MNAAMKWVTGGVVLLIGLVGLFLAANATDSSLSFAGFAIFVTSLLYVLLQVKLSFDQKGAPGKEGGGAGS
ncbi:MAG: hypothetical protein QNJ67_15145 [Kiloniellales bacterium]|nr:hypothetical protein [Kiloniellales bacterium]